MGGTGNCSPLTTHHSPLTTHQKEHKGVRVMKIYRRLLFGSLLASLAILRGGVHAQGPGAVPGKLYTQQKHFILPIELDERDRATISEVLLYVKSAPSEPWICRQSVLSTQKGFD